MESDYGIRHCPSYQRDPFRMFFVEVMKLTGKYVRY